MTEFAYTEKMVIPESFQNLVAIYRVLLDPKNHNFDLKDVPVICFYKAEATTLLHLLRRHGTKVAVTCDVSSVGASQGQEGRIVLIQSSSTVHGGETLWFLKDTRRLNVTLTSPQQLRLFFCHQLMGRGLQPQERNTRGAMYLRDMANSHLKDKQASQACYYWRGYFQLRIHFSAR